MKDVSEFLPRAIKDATESLQSTASLEGEVARAADMMEQCLRAGNKMLVCGNGGSAADAAHLATEFVVRQGSPP
jgi:phosphoheptose isomerase